MYCIGPPSSAARNGRLVHPNDERGGGLSTPRPGTARSRQGSTGCPNALDAERDGLLGHAEGLVGRADRHPGEERVPRRREVDAVGSAYLDEVAAVVADERREPAVPALERGPSVEVGAERIRGSGVAIDVVHATVEVP